MQNRTRQGPIIRRRPSGRRGFTLVEVAIAIVIVGVGSVALMQLVATCTTQNRAAADTTAAAMLAQHVQEMLALLPLTDPVLGPSDFGKEAGETVATSDDVDDFDGVTFSPCVDSTRAALAGFDGYSQVVSVVPVNAKKPSGNTSGTEIAKTTYTGAVRVRVSILRTGGASSSRPVQTLEWIRIEE